VECLQQEIESDLEVRRDIELEVWAGLDLGLRVERAPDALAEALGGVVGDGD